MFPKTFLSNNTPLPLIVAGVAFLILCHSASLADCPSHTPWHQGGQQVGGGSATGEGPEDTEKDDPANDCVPLGEPVVASTGEFYHEVQCLSLPGRGMDVEIGLTYHSGKNMNSAFGYGWSFSYHARLLVLGSGNAILLRPSGKTDEFILQGGSYIAPEGVFEQLVQEQDGTWTLTDAHGGNTRFDVDGNLAALVDRNGNQISFEYDPFGLRFILAHSSPGRGSRDPFVIAQDFRLVTITDTVGREFSLEYNDDGRLTMITDPAGRTVTFAYDPARDDLVSITRPSTPEYPNGVTESYVYDSEHNLVTIIDARGEYVLTNHYDSEGRVWRQEHGTGAYQYAYNGDQTTETNRKGYRTTWTFDNEGRAIRKEQFTAGLRPTDPPSYVTTYTYNACSQRASETFPAGNGVKYTYDISNANPLARGNLLEVRRKPDMQAADDDSLDLVTAYEYETVYNLIHSITDPEGYTTRYTYDHELDPSDPRYGDDGNLVTITYPAVEAGVPEVNFTYNGYGQIVETIDPNGNRTTREYYPETGYLHRVIQDPSGIAAVTAFEYDDYGSPATLTNPRGYTTTFQYNALGWLTHTADALGHITRYTYDQNGNLTTVARQADENGHIWQATHYTYTIAGKVATTTDPLGNVTSFNYDANGNLSAVTDPMGHTTSRICDERDLPWTRVEATTANTEFDYDANGNLTRIADARSHATCYDYDGYDRLRLTTYADSSVMALAHDCNSNLVLRVTTGSDTILYTHDALRRLTSRTYPRDSDMDAVYTYDLGSRMTAASTSNTSIAYTYDSLDRVVTDAQTIDGTPYLLTYQYDRMGNRITVTYPSGYETTYAYDPVDRMRTIQVQGDATCSYTYDALCHRIFTERPNNVHTAYVSDLAGRTRLIAHLRGASPGASPQTRMEIGADGKPEGKNWWDVAGQPVSELSSVAYKAGPIGVPERTVSYYHYTYDAAGACRVHTFQTRPEDGQQQVLFEYDALYQLVATAGQECHSYAYDAVGNRTIADGSVYESNVLNQYAAIDSVSLAYDGNGNLAFDGNVTYVHDAENRLRTCHGATECHYTYDALERRVKVLINGVLEHHIYSGQQLAEVVKSGNDGVTSYVLGAYNNEVIAVVDHGSTSWCLADGRESVTHEIDSGGEISALYRYDPYGVSSYVGEGRSGLGFTGQYREAETGLYYCKARHYAAFLGRFIERDPIGYLDGMNCYAYAGNSPMNRTDPYGLQGLWIRVKRGGKGGVGHAWITLESADGTMKSYGWWPTSTRFPWQLGPGVLASSGGPVDERSAIRDWDVARRFGVSDAQYALLQWLVNNQRDFGLSGGTWGKTFNCTDFVLLAAMVARLDVGVIDTFGMSDPNKLADWLEKQSDKKGGYCPIGPEAE